MRENRSWRPEFDWARDAEEGQQETGKCEKKATLQGQSGGSKNDQAIVDLRTTMVRVLGRRLVVVCWQAGRERRVVHLLFLSPKNMYRIWRKTVQG